MQLASVAVTRSVTWCGLPKAGSCSRLRCSATAAYSGDSLRSLRTVRDDLMRYAGAAISQAIPAGAGPGRPRAARVEVHVPGRARDTAPTGHLAVPTGGTAAYRGGMTAQGNLPPHGTVLAWARGCRCDECEPGYKRLCPNRHCKGRPGFPPSP